MATTVDTTPPPPAPDYPPENGFTPGDFATGVATELQKAGIINKDGSLNVLNALNPFVAFLTWLASRGVPLETLMEEKIVEFYEPFLKQMVSGVETMLEPGMKILGDLTSVYVKQFGSFKTSDGKRTGAPGAAHVTSVAQGMYDDILAPLEQSIGGANPATLGSGATNAHNALGSIVEIRLLTWLINIISNLTGIGTFKFINSFNTCITDAMNARSVERLASKPYLSKFILDPLTRDLNADHPITDLSAAQLIKAYVRGGITVEQLHQRMREKGFHEGLAPEFLLDTVKELGLNEVAYLVNYGYWSDAEATQYLTQIGYEASLANVPLGIAKMARVQSQYDALADELVAAVATGRLEPENMRSILTELGFPTLEINAYALRAATRLEFSRPLSLGQVQQLFQHQLVDATYVQTWLADEGYSERDQHLLFLLEFAKEEERQLAKATLGAQARFRSVTLDDAAATATTKNNQRLADAATKLAAKKVAQANYYGQ